MGKWEIKKTFVVDEFGIKRELVFYSRQDSNGTTQYYYDISDRNYTTFPFNEEMFDFYEKRSFLSSTSVFHDRVNELVLFNYPVKHVGLAVTKGKIILGNENFLVKPNAQKGDTMEVLLHHPLKGKFIKKFDLIVK